MKTPAIDGRTCHGCRFKGADFTFPTDRGVYFHLLRHRDGGDLVPATMIDEYDPDARRDATLDQTEMRVLEKATHTAERDEYGDSLQRGNYGKDARGEFVFPETHGGRRMTGATKRRAMKMGGSATS